MKTINYINGDATKPIGTGNKIITHVCNDIGGWGRGFVLAISNRWLEPEKQYRAWNKNCQDFSLGQVQFVPAENNLWVANMIGQRDICKKNGIPPVRYEAIEECLVKVADFAEKNNASVHMPRIGCGLAGADWKIVEALIIKKLCEKGIDVTVYDLG